MAGSFAAGFQMGGSAYNQAERNRLEQAAEDRRATEFAQAQEDRARLIGLRNEEDMLRQQLTRPNAENYALAAPGQGVGLRMGAQPAAQLPEEGLAMPQMAAPAGGLGMREAAAPGGLRTPMADTRQPTFNAAPTGAGAEEILGRMALLKGDTAGFRAAQVSAKGYKYEDAYKKSLADWSAMDDEAKQALIDKASYDTNIKGFGTWVPGKGKQAGYMNYMAPGQDPIKLSAKEAGELFALTNAMEHDPMRARGEMDKVSDKVRQLASQAFEAQTKGVTASNTAAHYANTDFTAGLNASSAAALRNAQIGVIKDTTAGRIAAADIADKYNNLTPTEQAGPVGQGLIRQFNMANVKAGGQVSLGKPPKEFDPKDYAVTVASFVNAGMTPASAKIEADTLYGRGPANIDAGLQKANADKAKAAAASATKTVVPVRGPLYANDEDYMGSPVGLVNPGYATIDARGLLRTPSYGAGINRFSPKD
jgi:hypothetical protein